MFKSYVKIYWMVWGLASFSLMAGLLIGGGLFGKVSLFLYIVLTWLPLGLVSDFEKKRLIHYLKSHHSRNWSELTSSGRMKYNDLKFYSFVFKRARSDEKVLARLKAINRQVVFLILFTFLVTFAAYLLTKI